MYYHPILHKDVTKPFQLAKELFSSSYENFDGDTLRFNGDHKNNFLIHEHSLGLYIFWKHGVLTKLKKEFEKVFKLPVYNIFVFYTPAHGYYQWHNEGTDNLCMAPKDFIDHCNELKFRRNAAINYKLTDHDLSKSKLIWGKEDSDVYDILKQNYSNAKIDENINIDNKYVISLGYESVLEDEKMTPVDEYYGMEVPTVVRTNVFHKIDNTACEFDRIVGTVSFEPDMYFEDVKNMVLENE
jgi:hypothetical protein